MSSFFVDWPSFYPYDMKTVNKNLATFLKSSEWNYQVYKQQRKRVKLMNLKIVYSEQKVYPVIVVDSNYFCGGIKLKQNARESP